MYNNNNRPRVTADTLQQRSVKNKFVQTEVRDILNAIDQDVTSACENNLSFSKISIPQTFPVVGNMTNRRAQLIIYNAVIHDLEDRGFHVSIDTDSGFWTISGWTIKIDDMLERDLIKTIASRSVHNVVAPSMKR